MIIIGFLLLVLILIGIYFGGRVVLHIITGIVILIIIGSIASFPLENRQKAREAKAKAITKAREVAKAKAIAKAIRKARVVDIKHGISRKGDVIWYEFL